MIAHIDTWKPARLFPHTYPGACPDASFLLINNKIYDIHSEDPGDPDALVYTNEKNEICYVNDILLELGLPRIEERYPVLAYGANRNPATLKIKLNNYNYNSPGPDIALPVLKGFLSGAEVVAANIYGQGYVYADIITESEFCYDTEIECWLNLLDRDQLRVMNESENLDGNMYVLSRFPEFTLPVLNKTIFPLAYAGNKPIFISPKYNKPIGYNSVRAERRNIPSMDTVEMIDHILDVFDLKREISSLTGLEDNPDLGNEFMKYLNGQWWYSFHTGNKAIPGYYKSLDLIDQHIANNSMNLNSVNDLKKKGLVLSKEQSFNPDGSCLLKSMI